MQRGRPLADPATRQSAGLQLRLTPAEIKALGRLHAARELDTGRAWPLAEIARELITTHPRFVRALKTAPAPEAPEAPEEI